MRHTHTRTESTSTHTDIHCTGIYKYCAGWSHIHRIKHTHTHTPPTWGHHTLGFPTQTCQAELPHQTKIDPVRSLQHLQNTKWKSCLQSHLSHLFTTTNPELHWRPCPFHYLFFHSPLSLNSNTKTPTWNLALLAPSLLGTFIPCI